jgi:signal transduction histidine kinase
VTRGARSLSRALVVRCFVVYLLSFAVISALVLLEFRLGPEAIEGRSLFARTAEVADRLERTPDGGVALRPPGPWAADLGPGPFGLVVRALPDRRPLLVAGTLRPDVDAAIADDDGDGNVFLTAIDRSSGARLVAARRTALLGGVPVEIELSRSVEDLLTLFATVVRLWFEKSWPYFVAMLALMLAAIHLTVRSTLAPVNRIADAASAMGADTLGRRLPGEGVPREVQPLVGAINDLLGRLDAAFAAQRRFNANAAHELKTPLAVLAASLARAPGDADLAAIARQSGHAVTQLLRLADIEAGVAIDRRRIVLDDLAAEVARDMAPAFVVAGGDLALCRAPRPVPVTGDAVLVGIALRNLLDNVLVHAPKGSRVCVRVEEDGTLAVEDDGEPLDVDAARTLFDPFVRLDRGRPGAGLGLSIVRQIAVALDGETGWRPAADGRRGNVFRIRLPLAADPAGDGPAVSDDPGAR